MSVIFLARNPASFEAAPQLLLDVYPGAAFAYDLQQLRTGVTNVIDVRRSSDNTVLAFTAQQIVDGTLLSWVGAGNNAFVPRKYDQTGNGRHATQTVPANQPQIIANGALITTNGKPALRYNGSTQRMDIPATPLSMNNFYAHIVSKSDSFAATQFGLSLPDNNRIYLPLIISGYSVGYADSSTRFGFGSTQITNQYLTQINAGSTSTNAWRNNSASTSTASSSVTDPGVNFSLGAYKRTDFIGSYWLGTIQGCVLYTSDQSANRAGIAAAMNALYGIY
jgi:hypothetical protein